MDIIPRWLRKNFRVKLGLFILAVILWFMVVSQRTYEYSIVIPIKVHGLRPDRVIINELPHEAEIKVEAQGRELIRIQFFNQPYLVLDLSTIQHFYTFKLRSDMVFFTGGSDVQLIDIISPETVEVILGERMELKLPVSPNIVAKPAAGYTFVDEFEISPSEVILTGPRDKIIRFTSLETDSVELINIKRNTELQLQIKVPDIYGVKVHPEMVKILIRVERLGEREVKSVPLEVSNVPSGRNIVVDPLTVDVTVSGGITGLASLEPDSIDAWVDFNEYNVLDGGRPPVHARASERFDVVKVSPDKVRLIVRRK